VAVGLTGAVFVAGGIGTFRVLRSDTPTATSIPTAALQDRPVIASGPLAQTIASLQARLRALPSDWQSWATLGLAYVQEARITADPTFYPKAEGALRRSLHIHPDQNFPALTGLGALALARHDFAGALSYGQRAAAINPDNANIRGVTGDALIELGRYPQAFAELQRMVDLRPGLSSYSRVSYAHELQGDPKGAEAIMKMALNDATDASDRAWVYHQLGELAFNRGDLAGAEQDYRFSHGVDPTFVPARAGLAKVLAATGRIDDAIVAYRDVVRVYPLPEYVIALIDLETVAGRTADAARDAQLLHVEERLFAANGVNMDLEIALFDGDHGVNLADGLAAAQREWGRRRSIVVVDALAWALYRNGQPNEALAFANRALHLGTKNALFHFHRGMIEKALGRTAAARRDLRQALAINPHFSILWAGEAAKALHSLEGAR
jgi:tetratricopeptide (TPR) repeat protein